MTAKCDGCSYAYDVSCAYCCGKSSGKRAELTDVAAAAYVFLHAQLNGLEDVSLWEFQPYGEKQVGAKKEDYHGPTP